MKTIKTLAAKVATFAIAGSIVFGVAITTGSVIAAVVSVVVVGCWLQATIC